MARQAFSDFAPNLSGIEALSFAENKGLYWTGPGSPALYDLTSFGRSLSGAADEAAGRAALALGGMATQSPGAVAITGGSALGLSGLQITGTTAPVSGSGLEIIGGSTVAMAAYNRNTSSYISISVDASAINFRPMGTSVLAATSSGVNIPNGNLTMTGSGKIGYETGAGGAVTQASSKATGVTLDKSSGAITMNAAELAASTSVSFTLTNSRIAATDVVIVNIKSGGTASAYMVGIGAVAAGSCVIHVRNVSGSPLSEALVLNFIVLKGVAA